MKESWKMAAIIGGLLVVFASITWAADTQKKEEQDAAMRVDVKVTDIEKDAITASITNLKIETAKESGFDKMRLIGTKTEMPMAGGKSRTIIKWNKAEFEGKTTSLAKAFESEVVAKPLLAVQDKFSASGDPSTLIQAWEALKKREKEKPQDDSKANEKNNLQQTAAGGGNVGGDRRKEAQAIPSVAPNFDIAKDPIITTTSDGCPMTVDIARRVATVQERVLTDGQETGGCSDTISTYPLLEEYGDCQVSVDLDNKRVYEQFRLVYTHPKSGERVTVTPCQPSQEKFVAITERDDGCTDRVDTDKAFKQTRWAYTLKGIDTNVKACADSATSYAIQSTKDGCSIRHSLDENVSYQQTRRFYIKDTGTVEVSSCQDDKNQSFAHATTRDGCAPVIVNGKANFLNRTYITVGATRQYLTDCAPEGASTTVLSEDCTNEEQYDHDFTGGLSYLKKRYYYMDGTKRVDVLGCSKSDTTFTHFEATDGCTVAYDDALRIAQLYSRTYITNSNRVDAATKDRKYLTTCHQSGAPIAYTAKGNRWRNITTTSVVLRAEPIDMNTNTIPRLYREDAITKYGWQEVMMSDHRYFLCSPFKQCLILSAVELTEASGGYCFKGSLDEPWISADKGVLIDAPNSDASPSFSLSQVKTLCSYSGRGHNFFDSCGVPFAWQGYYVHNVEPFRLTYTCTPPVCKMTQLQLNPVFERYDGKEYVDTNLVLDTKYVCGTGSKLDGKFQ
jgi:hypothetical protein